MYIYIFFYQSGYGSTMAWMECFIYKKKMATKKN